MSSFHSSVAKKIMVIRDSQIENTEINSISKSLCATCYKKEGEK